MDGWMDGWMDVLLFLCRNILDRLSIPYQDWNFCKDSPKESRGTSSRSEQEIKERCFPTLLQSKFRNMTWGEMYEYLFNEEHASKASHYATFETYRQNILTPEGSEFYSDSFGYEGEKRAGVSRT